MPVPAWMLLQADLFDGHTQKVVVVLDVSPVRCSSGTASRDVEGMPFGALNVDSEGKLITPLSSRGAYATPLLDFFTLLLISGYTFLPVIRHHGYRYRGSQLCGDEFLSFLR